MFSTAPLADCDELEGRLDARFAALEPEFAAFTVRAQNGPGRFEEPGGDAPTVGQVPTVIVAALRLQTARDGENVGVDRSGRQKVRKAVKSERDNERKKRQRDRHHDRQRVRR